MPSLDSADEYRQAVLRKVVASQCQLVSWQHISSTALDTLSDLLRHYVAGAARRTARYCEQAGRTLSTLDDAALALADLGVCPVQLERYLSTVEPPAFLPQPPPVLPVPRETRLNFLRPGSQEILTRPIHVYEHLPPMLADAPDSDGGTDAFAMDVSAASSVSPTKPAGALSSPSGSKRTADSSPSVDARRVRAVSGDETHPLRDLTSVMMTTSGFISPAVEGKMPEGRMPEDIDDQRDGHGKLKTRKQRADTYRRLSERENERKHREREFWSREEDLFDIIDVKVDDDDNSPATSPEKAMKPKDSATKVSKPPKKRLKLEPGTAPLGSNQTGVKKKFKEKGKMPAKPTEGKSKLSIFKKKPKQKFGNINALFQVSKSQKAKDKKNKQKMVVPAVGCPEPTALPSVASTSLVSADVSVAEETPARKKSVATSSPASSADPAARRKNACDAKKKPSDKDLRDDKEEPTRPVSPLRQAPEALSPDPSTLLNNPLIPRFPFPFVSTTDGEAVAATPAFPPLFIPPKSPQSADDQERPLSSTARALDPRRSPSVESNASSKSRSLSPPSKRPSSGAPTPLERLEMADRAEKKRDKEHKKNKKDKKDKRKKDKKDRDKKEEKSEKKEKKKRIDKVIKDDDVVPKLTVRIGGHDACSESSPSSDARLQSPPRVTIKPVKEESTSKPVKKEKLDKIVEPELFQPNPVKRDKDIKTVKRDKDAKDMKTVKREKDSKVAKKADKDKSPVGRKKKSVASTSVVAEPASPPASGPDAAVASSAITTETVGSYIDSEGNKVWICPTCGRQDDGSPMIGCDKCDDWYHWVCVGIQVPPDQDQDWYCPRCIVRLQEAGVRQRGRGRGRKKL